MKLTRIKLGDVLDIKRGTSLSGDKYATSGRLIRLTLGNFDYSGGGFKENTSKENIYYVGSVRNDFIMQKGDIITPLTEQVRGLLGETARIPVSDLYIQSQDIGKVIPNESKLDKDFAFYLISSPIIKYQLDAGSQQTKIRHTSPDKIKECIAWIPSLDNQRKIAKVLDSLNSKILLNKRIIKELESMAKTLYDYWFLQFEFPNEEGKPYQSSGGEMIWNSKLNRKIPLGWEIDKLKNITSIALGGTPSRSKKEYWENGTINWLNSGEISNFPIVTSNEKITLLGLENSSTEYMEKGTVVVSITGNIRVSILGINSCANQSVVGISESDLYKKEYIFPAISMLIDQFNRISTGNCQQHINKRTLEQSYTLIPPEHILRKYYQEVELMYNEIINNAHQNFELSELRDFLSPLLLNGQVIIK